MSASAPLARALISSARRIGLRCRARHSESPGWPDARGCRMRAGGAGRAPTRVSIVDGGCVDSSRAMPTIGPRRLAPLAGLSGGPAAGRTRVARTMLVASISIRTRGVVCERASVASFVQVKRMATRWVPWESLSRSGWGRPSWDSGNWGGAGMRCHTVLNYGFKRTSLWLGFTTHD